MSEQPFAEEAVYEITVSGHLDEGWTSTFEGLELETAFEGGSPITRLVGPVRDQAALHGHLARIRDLGLQIQSVKRLDSTDSGKSEGGIR